VPASASTTRGLRRDIGFLGAAFLALNGLVGAGIFGLPGVLVQATGAAGAWLIALFGLLMVAVAWSCSQLAGYFRNTGGPVVYATSAYGPFAGFQTGWLLFLSRTMAISANTNLLLVYASYYWPPLAQGMVHGIAVIALFTILTVVNVVGVKRAIQVVSGFTYLKLLPLFAVILAGFPRVDADAMVPAQLPEATAVSSVALLLIYAFTGFEGVLMTAGETVAPRRKLPAALMTTMVATALLYFLIQLTYSAVVGTATVEGRPLVEMGRLLFGPPGAFVLTLAVILSVGGNVTSVLVTVPRLSYALAKQGSLPSWFAHVHQRYATPDRSIIFNGALACVLTLSGTFVWLAVASALSRMAVYIICILAEPIVRRRRGGKNTGALGVLFPIVGFATCGWAAMQSTGSEWGVFGATVLAGTLLYWLNRKGRSRLS
jgi:basic amino acid/polyamine antiporter, APA family